MAETGTPPAKSFVQRLIASALERRIVRAYLRYGDHQGSKLADGITYRTLFSVFAAVLLGFSVAALWLGGNPGAMNTLADTLDTFIPGLSKFVDPTKIQAPAGFTIAGIASLAGLVGAAIGAVGSLRAALRTLGDQLHDDGFVVWVYARNLLVAVLFGGLLALAAGASMLGPIGITQVASWLGHPGGAGVLDATVRWFGILVVMIIDTVAIAAVFRLLAGVRRPTKALWGGALIGGVGLTVLQELSGLFVRGATSNPLLGSFAALIALLLWFNLSAQVILIASCWIFEGAAEAEDRVRAKFGAETMAQRKRLRAEDTLRAATLALRAAQEAEQAEHDKHAQG